MFSATSNRIQGTYDRHDYAHFCTPTYSNGKRRKRNVYEAQPWKEKRKKRDVDKAQPRPHMLDGGDFLMMEDYSPCDLGWLEISTVSDCQQAASELQLFYVGTKVHICLCGFFFKVICYVAGKQQCHQKMFCG